ncbi:MAG TPA: hypothetical protein VIU46_10535 [Gallionellaceae bacterium]
MVRRIILIVAGMVCLLAGQAYATGTNECARLEGKGAGHSGKLPPMVEVDKLIECAGMTQDVAELDRLDRDLLVVRAQYSTLEQLREKKTDTDPPRKYSELAPAKRLEKFKQLVDAYYKRPRAK